MATSGRPSEQVTATCALPTWFQSFLHLVLGHRCDGWILVPVLVLEDQEGCEEAGSWDSEIH